MPFRPMRRREPGGRRPRARYGGCLATVCLLAAGGCGGTPAAPTPVSRATVFITYEGLVFEPYNRETRRSWGDTGITPIPGARVTIIGGPPDGWTMVTDAEGRFSFEDYPFCELESAECRSRRFRVEKAEYETREVGASDPYRYRSGSDLDLDYSPYEKRVPMSREWPANAQIQRMRRELPAMRPLWLSVVDRGTLSGAYGGGHMWVGSLMPQYLVTLAHEYCHAHQDWVLDPYSYGGDAERWRLTTAEGRAFEAAWEADRAADDRLYRSISRIPNDVPHEFAAWICSIYFYEHVYWPYDYTVGPEYLREHLPHLHAWAEEWLRWRQWGERP